MVSPKINDSKSNVILFHRDTFVIEDVPTSLSSDALPFSLKILRFLSILIFLKLYLYFLIVIDVENY